MIEFTKRDFERWFEAQPDDRMFYEEGASQSCPISLFARDKGIGKTSSDGRILDTSIGDSSRYREWVERVQDRCDQVYVDQGSFATSFITVTGVPMKDLRHIIEGAL